MFTYRSSVKRVTRPRIFPWSSCRFILFILFSPLNQQGSVIKLIHFVVGGSMTPPWSRCSWFPYFHRTVLFQWHWKEKSVATISRARWKWSHLFRYFSFRWIITRSMTPASGTLGSRRHENPTGHVGHCISSRVNPRLLVSFVYLDEPLAFSDVPFWCTNQLRSRSKVQLLEEIESKSCCRWN